MTYGLTMAVVCSSTMTCKSLLCTSRSRLELPTRLCAPQLWWATRSALGEGITQALCVCLFGFWGRYGKEGRELRPVPSMMLMSFMSFGRFVGSRDLIVRPYGGLKCSFVAEDWFFCSFGACLLLLLGYRLPLLGVWHVYQAPTAPVQCSLPTIFKTTFVTLTLIAMLCSALLCLAWGHNMMRLHPKLFDAKNKNLLQYMMLLLPMT